MENENLIVPIVSINALQLKYELLQEVVPPEVAALYSSRPSTIPPPSSSSLPHSSSVNIDDVFAALDRRDRKTVNRPNLDDYYADPPSEVNH